MNFSALVLDNVRLVNRVREAVGLPEHDDVLPTEATLDVRRRGVVGG